MGACHYFPLDVDPLHTKTPRRVWRGHKKEFPMFVRSFEPRSFRRRFPSSKHSLEHQTQSHYCSECDGKATRAALLCAVICFEFRVRFAKLSEFFSCPRLASAPRPIAQHAWPRTRFRSMESCTAVSLRLGKVRRGTIHPRVGLRCVGGGLGWFGLTGWGWLVGSWRCAVLVLGRRCNLGRVG